MEPPDRKVKSTLPEMVFTKPAPQRTTKRSSTPHVDRLVTTVRPRRRRGARHDAAHRRGHQVDAPEVDATVATPTHHRSTRTPVRQSWCSPLDSSPSQLYGGQRHTSHHHHSRPPYQDGVVDREFAETPPTADAAKPVPWRWTPRRCHSRPRRREYYRHTHFAHFIEPVTWSTQPQSHPGRRLPMISSNRRQSQGAPPPPRFGTGVVPLLHYARTQWCLGDVVTRA